MGDEGITIETAKYSDGQIIFAEFETGDRFYLIKSGQVELVKIVGNVQKTLDVIGPPEMFGEMALLESAPRSASAIAKGSVELMVFDKGNFESLLLTNAQIAVRLLKVFAKRIYEAKRRFMVLTLESDNIRFADVLLMLCEGMNFDENKEQPDRREIRTTIEDVARWAALNASSSQQAVNQFISKGILEVYPQKKIMVIKNIKYLERLVETARTRQNQK
ncbi:Crp/Fnr family transcriptional regulator [Spirochaetia bacterium]|nr:Crp/Fnr family transcriptional regulator [Spirochaetia bacterium]